MKKILTFILLIGCLVGCSDNNQFYLYEVTGLGNVNSPVELSDRQVSEEDWRVDYYSEDKTSRLSMYLAGSRSELAMVYESARQQMLRAEAVDEVDEDVFEVGDYQIHYVRGYDKDENTTLSYLIFENKQQAIQVISFMSNKKNSDAFIKEFRKSFSLDEKDIASFVDLEKKNFATEFRYVGNVGHGYIKIPVDWYDFKDDTAVGLTQFSDIMSSSIVSLDVIIAGALPGYDIEDIAKASWMGMNEDEYATTFELEEFDSGEYHIYQYRVYYSDVAKGLTVMWFLRSDGGFQYLAVEGKVWILPYLEEMVLSSYQEQLSE